MTDDAIKKKVKEWLITEPKVEGFKNSISTTDKGVSSPSFEFKFRRFPMSIAFPEDREDSFQIYGIINLTHDYLTKQESLDDDQRSDNITEIQLELNRAEPESMVTVNDEKILKTIQLERTLWNDGLNKNVFFQSVISVRSALSRIMIYLKFHFELV